MSRSILFVSLLVAFGCGSSTSPTTDAGATDAGTGTDAGAVSAATITIATFAFTPSTLTVTPGAVITVINSDATSGTPHSVTSEAKKGDFTAGAVNGVMFDTMPITTTTPVTFTIPSTATSGTVVPFFCTVHGIGMREGSITVQ